AQVAEGDVPGGPGRGEGRLPVAVALLALDHGAAEEDDAVAVGQLEAVFGGTGRRQGNEEGDGEGGQGGSHSPSPGGRGVLITPPHRAAAAKRKNAAVGQAALLARSGWASRAACPTTPPSRRTIGPRSSPCSYGDGHATPGSALVRPGEGLQRLPRLLRPAAEGGAGSAGERPPQPARRAAGRAGATRRRGEGIGRCNQGGGRCRR